MALAAADGAITLKTEMIGPASCVAASELAIHNHHSKVGLTGVPCQIDQPSETLVDDAKITTEFRDFREQGIDTR